MAAEQATERPSATTPMSHRRIPHANVLVIEDDSVVSAMLQDLLEATGYRIWVAPNGSAARAMLDESRPDLVILDLMLPDVDGLVLCAELKAQLNVPIIICSATSRKRDAILGLRLGADDFIAKPFDIHDLEARIDAVLRRTVQIQATEATVEPDHYRLGDLVVDRSRRRVALGGIELQLTPTEYRLLSALISRPDDVFTRDELAQKAWGYQDASSGRAIDVHIRRPRVKLDSGKVAPPDIISVRGFGYKISREPREKPLDPQ